MADKHPVDARTSNIYPTHISGINKDLPQVNSITEDNHPSINKLTSVLLKKESASHQTTSPKKKLMSYMDSQPYVAGDTSDSKRASKKAKNIVDPVSNRAPKNSASNVTTNQKK
ncbi:hypothetical protein TorRG33x02_241860 [Trema orientale]|uniref:Uncharacterized protein n=1 Tax=Trema orientale TaxID=63057 RepID=A0A2P5DU13_TREOI|nr:hypothetical protein TorRG33x02_241860 [Trema orientale]